MIDLKLSKGQLCEKAKIGRSTVAKMGRDEMVALEVIEKICNALDCDIVDVVSCLPHIDQSTDDSTGNRSE